MGRDMKQLASRIKRWGKCEGKSVSRWARVCILTIFTVAFSSCFARWAGHNQSYNQHSAPRIHVCSHNSISQPSAYQGQHHNSGGSHKGPSFWSRSKDFFQKCARFSISNSSGSYARHIPQYSPFQFLNFTTQDFAAFFGEQIARGVCTEPDILRAYELYSNAQFFIFLMSLPGYEEHILSLDRALHGASKKQEKEFLRETGFNLEGAKIFFAERARAIKDKRAAIVQEHVLQVQANKFQQEELLRSSRKAEDEHHQRVATTSRSPVTLAQCVAVWHKKQDGANGARYKKRLAATQKAAQDLAQKKPKIKRVYKITDRDRKLIKELNLRKSDFVQLSGHELQHALHREFIGIARAISDTRTITVGSITGQNWTELLGAYLDTGMQVNKMGNCAQASRIADFCWTITVGLGEIAIGIGEGIWQGGKNVAHMVCHPLDTGYGAACALGVMLIGCGDIIMSTGDPELPVDNEYSTFQRARDPEQTEYLLHVYNSVMAQAKQATPRDIARGVTTVATEAILTAKLSSAAVKCITSINSRVPGALHRAFSCAPETAESFALADGGHMRFSKNALQALAESEAAGSGAAAAIKSRAYDVIDRFNKNRNLIGAFDQKIQKLAKKVNSKRVGKILTIDTHITKVEKIEAEAASFYDSMRQTMADVESIAKNTGLPKDVISKIKKHVFLEEHILDEGVRKFWPDADMAAAWKRLMTGDFVSSDLLLLQHEYAEAFIMNGIEIPYRQAHDFVDTLYNWSNAL